MHKNQNVNKNIVQIYYRQGNGAELTELVQSNLAAHIKHESHSAQYM